MSTEIFSFKDLLDLFFSQSRKNELTSAALILLWLDRPEPNALRHLLGSSDIDIKKLEIGLETAIDDFSENSDPWLLHYIANSPDLSEISSLEFLRKCVALTSHPLNDLFRKTGLTNELLNTGVEKKAVLPKLVLLQENAARSPVHLTSYGRDLIACAQRDEFPNLIKREDVFQQLLGALRKKRRGNVIITGPAGSGKTALAESLANELVSGKLTDAFPHYRLFEIHVSKLIAGTHYRGMFEERLEQIITEAMALSPVVLFIDEIHLIWGAGRTSESAMDASNILKPYLARGDIQIIGATTSQEYQRYIQSDPALSRRFEEIRLNEPDMEMTKAMVDHQLQWLVREHGLSFDEGCAPEAIRLTNRYLPNRAQPDKAIDLLDSVAAKVSLKGRTHVCQTDLQQAFKATDDKKPHGRTHMVEEMQVLAKALGSDILGQDEVIEVVSRTLILNKCQGEQRLRPTSFLFVGSSGVGKTTLAKTIASNHFGNPDQCLHLNLGDYNTPLGVAQILGSPGLSPNRKQGLLVAFLQAHPCGVLLFDEVEKGHPDIQNMMLGLLDSGFVTTDTGDKLSVSDCAVIATTNALRPKDLMQNPIGFSASPAKPSPYEMLSQYFRPELLNRFDEILLFNDLERSALAEIIRKELEVYRTLIDIIELERLVGIILRQLGDCHNARAAKRATRKTVDTWLITDEADMASVFSERVKS